MNITLQAAEAIADAADAEVYEGYSGRGMYGTKCLGFVVRGSEVPLTVAIVRIMNDVSADIMINRLRTDSLGLNTIVYFPGVTATATEED